MSIVHFIVNPVAGRGRVGRAIMRLKAEIAHVRFRHSFQITKAPGDARLFASRAGREDIVVAVGGDGTVNEIVNGVMQSGAALAAVPMGSGNDFSRMIRAHRNLRDISKLFAGRSRRKIDVGIIDFERTDGTQERRYFANGLGIGFDAAVSIYSRSIKYIRGLPLYLWAVLRTLPRYRSNEYLIRTDGVMERKRRFLICVGNGAYEGGGFKLTPRAKVDDGRLDICSIDQISVGRALAVLPTAMNGTHIRLPEVQTQRVAEVEISSSEPFPAHVDGEILGDDLLRVSVRVSPSAIEVIELDGQ